MATAQVEAWVGARKGSISEAARGIETSLADAALGRMMLHRRRAVTASVIGAFFARVGSEYAPHLESGGSAAPLDAAGERSIATQAGELAASLCGMPLPLQFERALLAEAEGRYGDALGDLKQVLAAYPGFVAGAVAAGRVALAAGEPVEAIRSLAAVEREITYMRDGAGLLADAARAIGLHETASQYDLAALISRGGHDSRGNDCAPVDLTGKVADDDRMPQTLYVERQADGSIICNAGGIYYEIGWPLRPVLRLLNSGRTLSTMRSLGPGGSPGRTRATPGFVGALIARLRLLLHSRFPGGAAWLRASAVSLQLRLRRPVRLVFRLIANIAGGVFVFLYRLYRGLPVPARAFANRIVNSQKALLQRLVRDSIGPQLGPRSRWRIFSSLSESTTRGLAVVRYQSGLHRIFGPGPFYDGRRAAASARKLPGRFADLDRAMRSSPALAAQTQPQPKLPPLAEDVLRRLVSETGIGRSPSPRS